MGQGWSSNAVAAATGSANLTNHSCCSLLLFRNGNGPIARVEPADDTTRPISQTWDRSAMVGDKIELFLVVPVGVHGFGTGGRMVPVPPELGWTESNPPTRFTVHADMVAEVMREARLAHFQRTREDRRRHHAAREIQGLVRPVIRAQLRQRHAAADVLKRALLPGVRAELRRRHSAATTITKRARGTLARVRAVCVICHDSFPTGQVFRPSDHRKPGCQFCHGCVRQYIRTAIDDGRWIKNLTCPGIECQRAQLSHKDVVRAIGRNGLAQAESEVKKAQAEWFKQLHDGHGADESFIQWCSSNTRTCPNCKVIIYRYAGCDHMSCRCGAHFTWTQAQHV